MHKADYYHSALTKIDEKPNKCGCTVGNWKVEIAHVISCVDKYNLGHFKWLLISAPQMAQLNASFITVN